MAQFSLKQFIANPSQTIRNENNRRVGAVLNNIRNYISPYIKQPSQQAGGQSGKIQARYSSTPSLSDKSQKGLLSLQQTRGNASILRPDVVYNAADSPDADIFGTRNANPDAVKDYFGPGIASSNLANIMNADETQKENLKLPGSGKSTGKESAGSAYDTAMRNIQNKKTTADRPWGSENTVKYGTDQEISMRQAANQLYGGGPNNEQEEKAAEKEAAENASENAADESEDIGIDPNATVIDPNTGERIKISDLTLAGANLAADDYAGMAAAQYLYGNPDLYNKYGDDWSAFQRNGTYDEWQAALSDPTMARYFTGITGDKDFQTDGQFDFDKYWQHAIGLDPMDAANLDDRDFNLVFGNTAGGMNAMNTWRRDMYENAPTMYQLSVNPDYSDEYAGFIDNLAQAENSPLSMDENGVYYNVSGDNNLSEDQLLTLLNMQTLQDSAMTYGMPDAYSLNELNMLSSNPGWGTTYGDGAADGYSNDFGMPSDFSLENYNPYDVNVAQLAYLLGDSNQVYDPTGYVMDQYMPASLYYTRNS